MLLSKSIILCGAKVDGMLQLALQNEIYLFAIEKDIFLPLAPVSGERGCGRSELACVELWDRLEKEVKRDAHQGNYFLLIVGWTI